MEFLRFYFIAKCTRKIIEKTTNKIEGLESFISSELGKLLINIDSSLFAQTGAIITSIETFYNLKLVPLIFGITSGVR